MKRIKTLFIFAFMFSLTTILSACSFDLSNLFGGNSSQNNFEIKEAYVLEEITEKHLDPCDYQGNHLDSFALGMLFSAYNGTRINFNIITSTTGTFEVVLAELAQENDEYFTVRNGDYTINDSLLILQNQNDQITFNLKDNKIIYSLPEIEVTGGEHEGHTAVYSFVFEVLLSK